MEKRRSSRQKNCQENYSYEYFKAILTTSDIIKPKQPPEAHLLVRAIQSIVAS